MHWKIPGGELGQSQRVLSLHPFLGDLSLDMVAIVTEKKFMNFDQFSNCLSRQGAFKPLLCHSWKRNLNFISNCRVNLNFLQKLNFWSLYEDEGNNICFMVISLPSVGFSTSI